MNRRDIFKLATAAGAAGNVTLIAQQWQPKLFDSHQNDTVVALTELIIPATDTPGAKAAGVNRWLDLLLLEGDDRTRTRFIDGLSWLDSFAMERHQKPFVRCTEAEQVAMLEKMDEEKHPFFRLAKTLTARVYYATEIGFKELNKGGRVPASFGCKHPSH